MNCGDMKGKKRRELALHVPLDGLHGEGAVGLGGVVLGVLHDGVDHGGELGPRLAGDHDLLDAGPSSNDEIADGADDGV